MPAPATTTLFWLVGQKVLDLIRGSDWRAFPPRLFWRPIFSPVLTQEYAQHIARDWNTRDEASGFVGCVLRFRVANEYLPQYEVPEVGGRNRREHWIPADAINGFNEAIVGVIKVVEVFYGETGAQS